MFSLQEPMPRGRYALVAFAHVLLLGGLLWAMVWGELNYLPPVGALAYLAGIGTLASLVAITIRRMRDAGIRSFLLLSAFAWGVVLALICLTQVYEAFVTPISSKWALPYSLVEMLVFCLVGCVLMPLTVAMLCAPSQKKRLESGTGVARFFRCLADGFANTFRFGGRASRSEFWCFALSASAAIFVLMQCGAYGAYCLMAGGMRYRILFRILGDPAVAVILSAGITLFLPLLSMAIRRMRDAGQLRRWLCCLGIFLAATWFFPHMDQMMGACSSAMPQEHVSRLEMSEIVIALFLLYSLYLLLKPARKAH